MPIRCEVIPKRDATPAQLRALGTALDRWCHQEIKDEGGSRRVDRQAVDDLLAGQLPQPLAVESLMGPDGPDPEADRRAVPLVVRGGPAYDRKATILGLRREIPAELVEDVLVAGKSWQLLE
jgi:hypothetical protein